MTRGVPSARNVRGWLLTGTVRGTVTGALYPAVVAVGPGVLGAFTLRVVPLELRSAVPSAGMSPVVLRPARPTDGERLREIERAAGERFREVDLAAIAEDEPMSVDELAAYATAGRSWVASIEPGGAAAGTDVVVGYVLLDEIDGDSHIEQISVDPSAQGRGIGRALLARAEQHAAEHGRPALTLTTFRDVPWNAPLYEHLGFRVLSPDEVGPGLAALVAAEADHGLDPEQRVCMRREVTRPANLFEP